jgi:GNAT superfamily N-acetyltransferase
MNFRQANPNDIPRLQQIRNAVKENTLSDPALIKDEDYLEFLNERGNGWVCQVDGNIVGFSMVDLRENNVWALFLHPEYEKQGIGRQLHDLMLHWYFEQTDTTIWLGTAPNTRAAAFYRRAGWQEAGQHGKYEIRFEMTWQNWQAQQH